MKRLPDWKKEEFEILLQNNSLSTEDLSIQLAHRTVDAVQFVRNGIHEFHKKGDTTLLSKMMKERLRKSDSILVCTICGERIDIRGG